MNTLQLGEKLCGLCREGKNLDAINTLYADDVVSVEAAAAPGMDQVMKGKQAVVGKAQWWTENNEVHSAEIQGPYPHGDSKFAVHFRYDVTSKMAGQRIQMDEVGVYTVKDGKVAREEFFYRMG